MNKRNVCASIVAVLACLGGTACGPSSSIIPPVDNSPEVEKDSGPPPTPVKDAAPDAPIVIVEKDAAPDAPTVVVEDSGPGEDATPDTGPTEDAAPDTGTNDASNDSGTGDASDGGECYTKCDDTCNTCKVQCTQVVGYCQTDIDNCQVNCDTVHTTCYTVCQTGSGCGGH